MSRIKWINVYSSLTSSACELAQLIYFSLSFSATHKKHNTQNRNPQSNVSGFRRIAGSHTCIFILAAARYYPPAKQRRVINFFSRVFYIFRFSWKFIFGLLSYIYSMGCFGWATTSFRCSLLWRTRAEFLTTKLERVRERRTHRGSSHWSQAVGRPTFFAWFRGRMPSIWYVILHSKWYRT